MAGNLSSILASVGFTPREAQLYLAGLRLGSAPASSYARTARLNRVTVYHALEDLVRRGFFTLEKRTTGKWYAPVAPEYIAVEVRKSVDALERSLPELRSMQGKNYRKPLVRYFEGWDGVRQIYQHTLTAQSEILNFANSALLRTRWERYDEEYVAQRVKRGIHLRGIAPDDAAGRAVHGRDQETLREIRLVPAGEFDFTNEINIYDAFVSIVSFGASDSDLFGVILESREVAETQRQIFELAWRGAGQ